MPDPIRFREIDDSNREDHFHLTEDDSCIYLLEYTAGQGYGFGQANSIISNLKKSPLLRNERQYYWKEQDIRKCTRMIQDGLSDQWLAEGTIVPIPPSKTRGHPEYDDRMSLICRGIRQQGRPVDVRDLIEQRMSTDAAHLNTNNRPKLEELIANYRIVERETKPPPTSVMLIDDVLTAGSHFKAAKHHLERRFPSIPIYGAFIARRALQR